MTRSMRAGLGLLSFGAAGLGLLAINPTANSANDPDHHGYIFAISHGPGLSLANANAPNIEPERITTFAATARSLACEVVLSIGSIEIGSRCAYEIADTELQPNPTITTGSISTGQN
ncbi:MAG: hypothetical protein AAFV69_13040 [Pseudomonadota bacterium]